MDILAMTTMFIDHLGISLFPDNEIFRIIGRLAFPLYAYSLAVGFIKTHSRKNYIQRLFRLALVSQIPYMLLLNTKGLNVIFTLLLSLIVLIEFEKYDSIAKRITIVLAGCLIATVCNMSYGAYCILLVLAYYKIKGIKLVLAHVVLNIVTLMPPIQMYSITANMLLKYQNIRLVNKQIYRYFYPAHLAVLVGVKYALGG
ncbi:TraX protein [Pelotomaculum sp. FP]|uniref:TraX family protein n=1 Tax=Pelotomaculum sp. FP TaxID=261474 RepID=UPI001101E0E0|nr:TraX family protein [Pelotomaculum sp. FP]TEB13557.1 TraX protein [Pelotomaculum sp. FP]